MKRPLIIAGAVLVLAIIVFASVRAGGNKSEKVYAEPVKARKIEAVVTAPGEVDPKVKVNIDAHIVGKIEKLYFQDGDMVRKGQKLVDLEKFAYQAQYDRARAALSNSNIEVTRAKAALGTSEAAYKRAVNMERQGIQAQELFDKARQDYQNAQAAYASALEGVRQADALLQQAKTDLDHTTIESPIDGKVVELNAHEGEVVVTGTMNNPASVIAVIADLSEILVEADVGETEVTGIKIGQKAKIHVDAVPDKEYDGHVVEIGSSAEVRQTGGSAGLRYFKVKVQFDNPDARLKPGMTSQVSIITTTAPEALSVPIQSVVERVPPALAKKGKGDETEDDDTIPKRKYAFVVKDGKAVMTEVKTGISDATHVAIESGLKPTDQVITGPFRILKTIKDGDPVQVTKEEKSPAGESEKS
jgi:HlyD family secretion protein